MGDGRNGSKWMRGAAIIEGKEGNALQEWKDEQEWRADTSEVVRVLRDLVAIPSVNPAFQGGTGEAEVGRYVRDYLEDCGIAVAEQAVAADRSNVIGKLPGPPGVPALLLEAHMDTVQTTGMSISPFAAEWREGRIYGRGACDTKASLAAMLVVMRTLALSQSKLPFAVHLAAVVDEEYAYRGVSKLAASIVDGEASYFAAVVGEPTSLNLVIAHKGCVRFEIETVGTPGHSSQPESGNNAIDAMVQVLLHVQQLTAQASGSSRHPLAGPPTCCVTRINGGESPNTIPGSCRITVDRRTVPGEEPREVWQQMKQQLESWAQHVSGVELIVHAPFIVDYPLATPPETPIVGALARSVREVAGRDAAAHGATYGTDASKLARVNVPALVFGPGSIDQAHTDDEWVAVDEVIAAADALLHLIQHAEWYSR